MTRFARSVLSFDWKPFLVLYLAASCVYYLATWWGYRQYDGTLPIWNVEEFFASSGLKFCIYFMVSAVLLGGRSYMQWLRPWPQAILALLVFMLATSILQDIILGYFGYVQFFGKKLSVFNYLLTLGFFALQGIMFLWVQDRQQTGAKEGGRERRVQGKVTEQGGHQEGPVLLFGNRGKSRVPLRPVGISHIIACRNYATAHNEEGSYLLDFGIGEAEKRTGSKGFMRVHRSYLVNLAFLKQIEREGRNHIVVMAGGERIPIGAKYLGEMKKLGY